MSSSSRNNWDYQQQSDDDYDEEDGGRRQQFKRGRQSGRSFEKQMLREIADMASNGELEFGGREE
jgi:hypothetical protein